MSSHYDDHKSAMSMDSVFDWGSGRSGNFEHEASDNEYYSSRYDPDTMSRTTDDILARVLADDDSYDSSSADSAGHYSENGSRGSKQQRQSKKKESQTKDGRVGVTDFSRKAIVIVSLVGIIITASLAIGYAVVSHDPSERPTFSIAMENGIPTPEQSLLEIAERVVTSCSEQSLDQDRSKCQQLCHSRMCCFESGDYSCEDDGNKACGVYAGCEALVEGILLEGAGEDEE